jgi:glucoamylase
VGGEGNNAFVIEVSGRELLAAQKKDRWMVVGASCPFKQLSCGYVAKSDGYTDLKANHKMTFEFDEAKNGNVALVGELDLSVSRTFTIAISFGETMGSATSTFLQSLGRDFLTQRRLFIELWRDLVQNRMPLDKASCDGGKLYRSSYNVLLSHEDKIYQGAFVASLTIPWGEVRNDDDGKGGYHLVWTRDMVQTALGLLAAGNTDAPVRVLIYLAARQQEDGGFTQNFQVDGKTFRHGSQLDEVAFPVILAGRLRREGLLGNFDAGTMVRRAINCLLLSGPVTGEERWEEAGGYSPSTLAAIIAACICAAVFERERGQSNTAAFLESYADFLVAHLKEWTVTSRGYFVRLNPAKKGQVAVPGSVDRAGIRLTSQPPGTSGTFPAAEIVDAGFLQLVRYGILTPDNPLILRSLREVDEKLQMTTPGGPCWRRYNHDGYGQRPDGTAYDKWGKGRSWPLLTGERAHYELAAGNDCKALVQAMEAFSGSTHLLPEQIWDEADLPEAGMRRGGPTGSAVPLCWAHSEYIRLLRSRNDGTVFDLIPEVARRYGRNPPPGRIEFWLFRHPLSEVRRDCTARICAAETFSLRWSSDNWMSWRDDESTASGVGAEFVDLPASAVEQGVQFTFFWKARDRWEGRNFEVKAKNE